MSVSIEGMTITPTTPKETITQYSKPNPEIVEEDGLNFDFSEMRTHRLPEDDEGMDETNQIPSRMPKALRDQLNGVTPDNPQGVTQLVTVRLHNKLVDKLKVHGSTMNKGYQTLIVDILKDYAEHNNL